MSHSDISYLPGSGVELVGWLPTVPCDPGSVFYGKNPIDVARCMRAELFGGGTRWAWTSAYNALISHDIDTPEKLAKAKPMRWNNFGDFGMAMLEHVAKAVGVTLDKRR